MPALSTSYLRRKVAQKQLSENKKNKKASQNDYLEAHPFKVAALSRGEVLGPKGKTKNQKQKGIQTIT